MTSSKDRAVRRTPKIEPRGELAAGERVEISYAPDSNVWHIKNGHFDPKDSGRDAWTKYLGAIRKKLGPQGTRAARRGSRGTSVCPSYAREQA